MTNIKSDLQSHTIVVVGDFNPKIFQPAWFEKEELLRGKEVEEAKIEIIHSDVVVFNVGGWLKIQVTRERFSASTTQEPYYEVLRDLVSGTFRILQHTPLRMLGINWEMHFRMRNQEEWHAFGDSLTPKDSWKKIFKNPGMQSLIIEENPRPDGLNGCIRVKVEPSKKVQPGVLFNINDHFEIKNPDIVLGSEEIINVLEEYWSKSCQSAKEIIKTIME